MEYGPATRSIDRSTLQDAVSGNQRAGEEMEQYDPGIQVARPHLIPQAIPLETEKDSNHGPARNADRPMDGSDQPASRAIRLTG